MTLATTRIRCALVVLTVFVFSLAVASPARAQFGAGGASLGGLAGMGQVGRSELKRYGVLLKLDEAQAAAAEELRAGYVQASQDLSKDFQAKMEQAQERMQDGGDMRGMGKEMGAAGREFGQKTKALEKVFFDDLRALLTPDQDARWPRVERARRRSTGMRFSLIAGQSVDLLDVVSDIGAGDEPSPDLADALTRYELDIDKSILVMQKWQEDQEKQQQEMEDAFDPARWQEMMKKAQEVLKDMSQMARGMRDVNRQYARAIGPLLPANQQAKFEDEFKRRSFPRVYREPWIVKAIGTARKFDDLNADQRRTLTEIEESYVREAAGLNTRWATAIDERDEKTGGQFGAMMAGFSGGGDDGGVAQAVTDARKARRDLDARYKEKLNMLLGEDQRTRLPKEERDRGDQFDFVQFQTDEDEPPPPPSR